MNMMVPIRRSLAAAIARPGINGLNNDGIPPSASIAMIKN
jgi:hypothetical protein